MARKGKPDQQGTRPPETYAELRETIASRYKTLSAQLQRIARIVLEYPNEMALETVARVAIWADVQPSSMVRFAKAMGYEGFSEMQQVFRSRLLTQSGNYRERIEDLRQRQQGGNGNRKSILADSVEEGVQALRLLQEHISQEDFERATSLLAHAESIYVLAERRSFPVAFYLDYGIGRLERRVFLLDGLGGMLSEQARTIRPQDVLIGVSFPPYSAAVVELFAEQKKRGVATIAITDSPVSPIALEASVAFSLRQQEERDFRSLAAPMCFARSLVLSLGHSLAGDVIRDSR